MEGHYGANRANDRVKRDVGHGDRDCGDERADKEVSEQVVSTKVIKSLHKCLFCFLIYDSRDGLEAHVKCHQRLQKIKEKNFPTGKVIPTRCDYLTSPYRSFAAVIVYANNNRANSLIGKICNENNSLEKALEPRISTQVRSSHKCDICSKSFWKLAHLNKHRNSHTHERPYKCQVCLKSFGQKLYLKSHIMRTHIYAHKCRSCSIAFGELETLKQHNMQVHGPHDEKSHQCQVCLKSFGRQRDLKRHMQSHIGDRPHKCQVCSKSFTQSGGLKQHMQIHVGDRPHQCQICLKSFTRSGGLKQHMQIHTGARPHKCQICSKSFKQPGHLKYHILTHDGMVNYPINVSTIMRIE